jgi:hypothetical protein
MKNIALGWAKGDAMQSVGGGASSQSLKPGTEPLHQGQLHCLTGAFSDVRQGFGADLAVGPHHDGVGGVAVRVVREVDHRSVELFTKEERCGSVNQVTEDELLCRAVHGKSFQG